MDLNVEFSTEADTRGCLETCKKFGWTSVAFSHTTHIDKIAEMKGKELKEFEMDKESIPARTISKKQALLNQLSKKDAFRQLHRLNLIVNDANHNILSKHGQILSKYHLIAVKPTNEKAFVAACSNFDIDIISFDFTSRLPFYIKATTVNLAIQRGIYFEINYSQLLAGSDARRHVIANVYQLLKATGKRNILFSSGANSQIKLRRTHDIMNLSILFGLQPDFIQKCITTNAESCLYHAACRQETWKGAVAMDTSL